MAKEAKVKKTNLKLVIFLILFLVLLSAIIYYAYDYYLNAERGYRRLEAGKYVKEALIEKESVCRVNLRWHLDFDYIDEIKLTFYDEEYNKYDYVTYRPSYDLEVKASDLGLDSFEKIIGVEAEYHYKVEIPSPNQTNITEAPNTSPGKGLLELIKRILNI
jgi:hypothetical protein